MAKTSTGKRTSPGKRTKGKTSARDRQPRARNGPDKYVIIKTSRGSRVRSKHRLPAVCSQFRWYGGDNMSDAQAQRTKALLDGFARQRWDRILDKNVRMLR